MRPAIFLVLLCAWLSGCAGTQTKDLSAGKENRTIAGSQSVIIKENAVKKDKDVLAAISQAPQINPVKQCLVRKDPASERRKDMLFLAKLIGVLIMSLGLAAFLRPELLKTVALFWQKEKRLYAAGVLRIMFGLIILLAAPQSKWFWVVTIFGLASLSKGVIIFVLKPTSIKSLLKIWSEKPPMILRPIALLTMALGALLIYSL